jgi:hypothetical protein
MALDTLAVANRLVAILAGISGINAAQLGVPEKTDLRCSAYVTAGSQLPGRHTTGSTRRKANYFVLLVYRPDGNEAAAETALMGILDAFIAAIYADLTLAGTCKDVEINMALADAPEYQTRTGKEFREYPIIITATQDGSYNTNP